MQNLLQKLDYLAGIESDAFAVRWLRRTAFIFLTLMVVSAPHSIAATQISWGVGTLAWAATFFFRPRTPLSAV
mgnify:FL=1